MPAIRKTRRRGRPGAGAPPGIGGNDRGEPDFVLDVDKEALREIVLDRAVALTHVYTTLDAIQKDLKEYFPKVPLVLPSELRGQLLNPDGSPAERLMVEVAPPQYTAAERAADPRLATLAWPRPRDVTDVRGAFSLRLAGVPLPGAGLRLQVKGSNASTELALRSVDVSLGDLGFLPLAQSLAPLGRSIIAQLKDIVPKSPEDAENHPEDFAEPAPQVTLGEGDCARYFRSHSGVIDRFSYAMLIRLVAPQVGPKEFLLWWREGERFTPLPLFRARGTVKGRLETRAIVDFFRGLGKWRWVDRVPIDRPIDTDGWRTQAENDPVDLPKAATLGVGYVVRLHQTWIPVGLSLGDMLYALPLAPGEEQRVAIYERAESLSVRESEALSIDEAQQYREAADSSTLAIFNSSYREAASGGSSMETSSDSWGIGGAGGIGGFVSPVLFGVGVAGGYGSSSSSGSTTSWQQGSRDFVSTAAQDFHSRLSRSGAVSRRSGRTAIRVATATEREQVTTKLVANHNHCHALTMQYWEVLRHFAVTSKVDDVQLVAFVPMELIQFLPARQPRALPAGTYTRQQLLQRYGALLHYLDVLSYHLQRRPEYLHGLTLLKNFAANPTTKVEASTGLAQVVVSFQLRGTFLPFEDTYVTLMTKTGARVGPVKLIPSVPTPDLPANTFANVNEVLQELRTRRNGVAGEVRSARLVLPDYIARSDVSRFDVTRGFRAFTCTAKIALPTVGSLTFGLVDWQQIQAQANISLSPAQLEQAVGGPFVWDIRALIQGGSETYVSTSSDRASAEAMATMLPIPALRIPPLLSFVDLLRIEAVFQHVVRNTVTYSKAGWISLTPEERAILLERYTIGVPQGGVADASQEVPLLNCVANEVLGYFGNAMIMPFHIPPQVAETMRVTTRDVQEALLTFHRQAFVPPQSSITLPARGMLGEAVLGSCTSCEKIDLTRFWNWKDSPIDTAEKLKATDFRGQTFVGQAEGVSAGVSAPNTLTSQPANSNMLTISTTQGATAPSSDLLTQMMKQMPAPTTFADLTGLSTLAQQISADRTAAEAARRLAMEQAKNMADKVIDKLPDVLKAARGVEEKDAEATKSALEKLSSNATSFIGVAGAEADQPAADKRAKAIFDALFGKNPPSGIDLATLYDKFKVAAGDTDEAIKRGKKAFLRALGLPVG